MGFENNLNQMYTGSKKPNVIGRDNEMFQIILSLTRIQKGNVLLVGEPGVGKTALVHQLAWLINQQVVPQELWGYTVVEINTNALLAGPGYRGVVEDKFQKLIDDTLTKKKVILFFDEFHTVESLGEMSNGSTPGLGDTLKPYLTRSDFRVIGATTNEAVKEIKDSALLRRFNMINVPEPEKEACLMIIENLIERYNTRKVSITCSSIAEDFYNLSLSLPGFNPDKCKDIVDLFFAFTKMKDISLIDSTLVEWFSDNYVSKSFSQPMIGQAV